MGMSGSRENLANAVPSLEMRKRPGLSITLEGPRAPDKCQSCGGSHSPENPLGRWQECDEWDKKTRVVVILCRSCSEKLIDAHPRLYHEVPTRSPYPGAMSICLDCIYRDGVSCNALQWKHSSSVHIGEIAAPLANSALLEIRYSTKPTVAHVCGGKRSGLYTFFPGAALECSAKKKSAE